MGQGGKEGEPGEKKVGQEKEEVEKKGAWWSYGTRLAG